ncbi:hypothetical protein BY996DRAFT_4576374 [Phakopsora pachyrhizi]|nr:hypothetical protein BY996DRAFT_4576374 [Phakopsora pachyrhizi]
MLKRKRELEPDLGITNNKEKIYHQFVSEKSTDPVPEEVILSQTSLKKFYTPLYKNKVRLFTERNKIKENILIAKFFPFDEMKEEKLDGWQFLVSFLLNQCCFNKEVNKSNSSLISGKMFAEGWRKAQEKKQIIGRYGIKSQLICQIKEGKFNLDDEKAGFKKIGLFLSNEYHQLAAGAHESCEKFLQNNSIPSFSQLNYNKQENTYCPGDFSSAITYTFDDFSNKPHCDNDEDNWTLIGFVPIFKDGTVAREGFDIEGGEFVLRDLKVFIDFSRENGVVLLILKTSKYRHQTISSFSRSGNCTRFGFSCQISSKVNSTMEKYLNNQYNGKRYTFGNMDSYIKAATNEIKKNTQKKIDEK